MIVSRYPCIYVRDGNKSDLTEKKKGSMGRKEGYISDVSHVGDHSRPTPRSAYVIFNLSKLFFVVIRATFILNS